MSITTDINIHGAKAIKAHSPSTLGAPLILSITGQEFPTCGSITIFMQDQALVDRLVEAINGAAEHKCEPDLAHQEAHDAVERYDYYADDMAFDAAREARMFKR